MGIRSTRPLPLAHAELALAPFFRRRFRSWHLEHARLALQRYRLLTSRCCVDALQLSAVLGIKEQRLVDDVVRLFLPRTPTRVQCMVDAMEVLIALVLVCQAPGMLQRFELIFDIADLESKGAISTTDLILLCGAVGRAIMKLFEYKVEPEQHAAMAYVTEVLDELGVSRSGLIQKEALCKFMVSDRVAVHYAKQCTGEDKPKLYIMMEKDAEFLGAVEFSNEQHMQTTSLRTVRDMIDAQVHRLPKDFLFLCQGREVEKVWEVDRRAWSIVPFALRGSPGLRTDIMAKNRKLERPAVANPFEFRYMGNLISRYKKDVHDIKPVYKHRAFQLRKNAPRKRLEPAVQWRVATTWSGEWIYKQQLIKAKSKAEILKSLRTAARSQEGVLVVKSHFGDILSPCSMVSTDDNMEETGDRPLSAPMNSSPSTPPKPEQRMQRIAAMALCERKRESRARRQKLQWKARLIAMEAQHQMEEKLNAASNKSTRPLAPFKSTCGALDTEKRITTVLVHVEEDDVLPSRLVQCEPKKRPRPEKLEWSTYQWDVPKRFMSSLPRIHKKLKVSKISDDISLTTPAGTSSDRQIGLGRFLSSTRVYLENNQVEVFPVLIIRPLEEQICVNERVEDVDDEVMIPTNPSSKDAETVGIVKSSFFASKTYLTEFEYEISSTESNFEVLYQHVASGVLKDAIWLNRRDTLGRTMLHDAAEFGHANVMELLLKARVIVDAKDSRGDTALHHAARHGRLKEVSMLLREHATPWLLNAEGKSPLYNALETAAKRSSGLSEGNADLLFDSKSVIDRKNFFQAHRTYPQLRQVIDLLWDKCQLEHLVKNDSYDCTNCLELEKQVYGDMIEACRDGNLLRVQRLVDLEKRPVLRYINDQMEFLQRTALHEATEQGHTATVDLLLKLGANGCLRDQRLQTPLHLAAFKGNDNIVKCLLSKFPQAASYQDVAGCTPLHLAIQQKRWDIAADLISLIQTSGEAIYHDSIQGNHVHCLDLPDIRGYTALHYACIHGNFGVCTALVNAGAARSVSRCEYRIPKGVSHLFGLWWKGDLKRVGNRKHLIDLPDQCKIIDIEAPVELLLKGWKQHLSNYQERLSVLDLLLGCERAIDPARGHPSLVKTSQCPLFHLAADLAGENISVSVEICRRLHKFQVMINMTHPQTNETVLLQECKRICAQSHEGNGDKKSDQLALIRCLLELGANVDLANEFNGESPLGCAAWFGHLALLDLLLEAGADKNGFARRCSYSPLHFAALGNNLACAKLLIGRSATVNVEMPPANAETPLYFAIRSKSEKMVDLLLNSNGDPCSLCTVQHRQTSFGIDLSIHTARKRRRTSQCEEPVDHEHEVPGITAVVVSPLTFGLLIAQSLKAFCVPEEANCTVLRSQKYTEWKEMESICLKLANKLLEDNEGSKGAVIRDDVHLASVLGFWELVQLLLSQQITLSNAPSAFGMNALHLAAAAGQTKVVTALVAGGMDVNCVIRSDSSPPKKSTNRRTWYEWIGYGQRGPLFYALIHGHTQTAAKLLVLGADAGQTIPHTRKKVTWRDGKGQDADKVLCERMVVRFMVSEAMTKAARTKQLENKAGLTRLVEEEMQPRQVDNVSVNLIHLIECSINQRVPLLHLVVALGHFELVRILVEAGMSIFSGFVSPPTVETGMAGWKSVAETPIHIAIACGHLEIVEYFASLVHNHFPGCFVREGKAFKSLLVTACEAHQSKILHFLVRDDGGGGFTLEGYRDEFQSALCTCVAIQFVEGFKLLVLHRAQPDVSTLVSALKGIISPSKYRMVCPRINLVEVLEVDGNDSRAAFRGERYQHDLRTHSLEVAIKLLEEILPPKGEVYIGNFLGASPIFELIQKILVICSRYQLWFVLDRIFVQHADYFVDVTSLWKPVLVRAASSCFVLHRAAMHNQLQLVAFLLRLGVSANLQLEQAQPINRPIWYAASRGSLESFVYLALRSTSFVEDLIKCQHLNSLSLVFRSIEESTSTLSTSDTSCRWQNLGVFGCIDVPRKQTNGYLIQKFINYGIQISHGHVDNSLLHHACRRGELIAVQTLVEGGGNLFAANREGESPLEVASGRKDSFGVVVVRYLLTVFKKNNTAATANIINRALVNCFAQKSPCNLSIAQSLLDSGANARFSYGANENEAKTGAVGSISAIFYAMQSAEFAGVKLLVDHGAVVTVPLSEAFLAGFLIKPEHTAQLHWRRFSKFLKRTGGKERLLNVESVMVTLLKKNVFPAAMNPDLLHQMLTSAAAIAATIAREIELDKKFWIVVNKILEEYPKEASSRNAEWNQKAALHYAVACLETPTVIKLLELRGFDLLVEDENKQTPLHLAAAGGDEVICRLLLTKLQSNTAKATAIDVPDSRGRTPLHLAVIHGHETVASMLLAAGASLDIRCRDGLTALLYAAKCNRLAILIVLHSRLQSNSQAALLTSNGEAGIFVAARHGAFAVVRWFMNLYEENSSAIGHASNSSSFAEGLIFEAQCCFGRTILHYLAIYGDDETLELTLKPAAHKTHSDSGSATPALQGIVNARDKCGYTPLMYAFAFGRLKVIRTLCNAGADPYVSVDHSGDPEAHPYTIGFDIAGLLQWFALPGWYSFTSELPAEDKRRLVHTTIEEDYLWNSSYNYRRKRRPPIEWRCKWKRIPAGRLLKSEPRRRGKELVRTSLRSWRFPKKSIFDYACEMGIAPIAELLANLHLPQLFRSLTYQAQRRNFMQAVRWNQIKIVQTLVGSTNLGNTAIESATGNHFLDFLEVGIECAVSRGLEDMAIYLVSQWQGIKENGRDSATPSAFAFQFASAFQVACIRRLPNLMERMIERGGEELVEFNFNEGPALTYAFAFGHTDIAALLLRNGADPNIPTATYAVPSVRKWVQFGSPKNVFVSWQPSAIDDRVLLKRPPFVGPIDTYETFTPRLPIDELCRTFADITFDGSRAAGQGTGDKTDTTNETTSVQNRISGVRESGNGEKYVLNGDEAGLSARNDFDSPQKEDIPPGEIAGAALQPVDANSSQVSNNDEGKSGQMMDNPAGSSVQIALVPLKDCEEESQSRETEPAQAAPIDQSELNNDSKAVE